MISNNIKIPQIYKYLKWFKIKIKKETMNKLKNKVGIVYGLKQIIKSIYIKMIIMIFLTYGLMAINI